MGPPWVALTVVGSILSGPVGDRGRGRRPDWPEIEATKGRVVRHRTTGTVGEIIRFAGSQVTLRDGNGREHVLPTAAGAFSADGRTVTLTRPAPTRPATPTETASGSIPAPRSGPRVARGSRILVEGLHDAELVEKVWGDDLRAEGVVVLPLHGADDLAGAVAEHDPGPERRIGVLLDHFVADTKEWRLAAAIEDPNVLVTGHPYVDVWQAIKPTVVGIVAWPTVPRGQDWKTGICDALGFAGSPGELWPKLLGRVGSYRDLEPGLVGAVEQLIDFVAPPPGPRCGP